MSSTTAVNSGILKVHLPQGTTLSATTPSGTSFSTVLSHTPLEEQEVYARVRGGLYPGSAVQVLSAKLYFKFIKSKLTKVQQEKLKAKLGKLSSLIEYSKGTNQLALYEESAKKILEVVKEQEAAILGIDYFVTKDIIDKHTNSVRDKVIRFKKLAEFPRIIPKNVRVRLKSLQEKELFDEYHILYTDYTAPSEEIKSTKQKIIEKDPILFGSFNIMPEKFYFIADWQDEYCDLTFDKLVDKVSKLDSDFTIPAIANLDEKYVQNLKKEIIERQEKLKATNARNFKALAASENSRIKKTWLSRLLKLWSK